MELPKQKMKKLKLKITYLYIVLLSMLAPCNVYAENIEHIFLVSFGYDSLFDIQEKYGYVDIVNSGDASGAESYVCYFFYLKEKKINLKFFSNNELAGAPDYELTRIELTKFEEGSVCKNKRLNNLNLINKLSKLLTMDKSEFMKKFGFVENSNRNDFLFFEVCTNQILNKKDSGYFYWKDREECFGKDKLPFETICKNYKAIFDTCLVKLVLRHTVSIC